MTRAAYQLFLLILLQVYFVQPVAASHYFDQEEKRVNIFLGLADSLGYDLYTTDFYDSIGQNEKNLSDVFFSHLGKAANLLSNDIRKATKEIIAAKILRSNNPSLQQYSAYLNLMEGKAYTALRRFDIAESSIDIAEQAFIKSDNLLMQLIARGVKTRLLALSGKYQEGMLIIQKQLLALDRLNMDDKNELYLRIQLKFLERKSSLLVGISAKNSDSLTSAKNSLMQTINKAKDLNDGAKIYNATGNLSYIYLLEKKYAKMIPLAKRDLSYSLSINNYESAGMLNTILAQSYFQLGIMDSVAYHLSQADKFLKYISHTILLKDFAEVSLQYYQKIGNTDEAFQTLFRQFEQIEQIYAQNSKINFDLLQAEVGLQRAEEKIQNLELASQFTFKINLLLTLLVVVITILLFNFYKHNRIQKSQRKKLAMLNQNLEQEVKRRTKKTVEQGEKLRDFAFQNSHRTRAPVSRLLGLVNLLNTELGHDDKNIVDHIKDSAKEIDEIIIEINQVLTEGGKQQ